MDIRVEGIKDLRLVNDLRRDLRIRSVVMGGGLDE